MKKLHFRKYFGLFAISIIIFYLIYNYEKGLNSSSDYLSPEKDYKTTLNRRKNCKQILKSEFLVNTPGCQIPNLDPFDPEVRKFYSYRENKECPLDVYATANRTHLNFDLDKSIKVFGHYTKCGYKRIWRNGSTDNKYVIDDNYTVVSNSMAVTDEFLKVGCEFDHQSVYADFFPFIQVKPKVEGKCNINLSRWVKKTKRTVKERLSLTFVGIDSVSRLNMLRHMPKTFNYLRNEMNAIDLQGYTKVADNTFVNIVPMLSGLFVEECWSEYIKDESLNYMNLIWKDFAEKGYRTLFAEDVTETAIFNYLKAGFFDQPTDYYLRPFTLAAKESLPNGNGCYNNRLEFSVVTQWLTDFLETFREKLTFSFVFNSGLTHQYLNDAGFADEPSLDFLTNYYESKLNNNSILLFFSDHGIRFGEIRNSYIGKIEERMPFFFLVFPPWFQSKYPKIWKNLEINQNRLITPFDIYATLKDVLNFTGKERKVDVNDQGISLFLEIPAERTCENAAILPHWCTCEERTLVDVKNIHVKIAAEKLVDFINRKIYAEEVCAVLTLDKILDARVSGLSDQVLKFRHSFNDVLNRTVEYGKRVDGVSNFLITVLLKPSEGLFEATVQYFEATKMYVVSNEISRINVYGKQSSCVENAELRKFCYCKK